MSQARQTEKMWFAPHRYGYGAGLPISWEGWLTYSLFFASAILIPVLANLFPFDSQRDIFQIGGVAVIVVMLVLITSTKTRGDWRWRWGDDD